MRLDPDTSSSNGTQHQANGSSPTTQKNGISTSTNGHSSPTNGAVSPNRNGFSSSVAKTAASYYGHDREEVTRLLIQSLDDLGYQSAANRLSQESGYEVESPVVAAFRNAIIQGHWPDAESLLFGVDSEPDGGGVSINNGTGDWSHLKGLKLAEGADQDAMKFSIREQKYLELLEIEDRSRAMMVLRQELQPVHHDRGRLDALAGHLVCSSPEALMKDARWDGARGHSRHNLLQDLSKSISPSVMIPEHRLAALLNQLKQSQIANCLYHNPSKPPSLFADHMCDRSQFPLKTQRELSHNRGEVWCLEFSPNGKRLAAGGSDPVVVIYDTSNFQVQHILGEHTMGVVHVAWSPDSQHIITCSQDHSAKVWNMDTGKCTKTVDHHNNAVAAAAWAPDSHEFVTGSHDKQSQLCLWNLHGRLLYSWNEIDHRIQGVVITPDGQRMATISSEKEIVVYNFPTRAAEREWPSKTKMTCINASRDSKYILVSMANDEIDLFDLDTGQIVRRYLGQKQSTFVLRSTLGGRDQNLILSGSEDSLVYIWNKESGTLLETLVGHSRGCVNAISWNPADAGMFASGGDDARIRIWSKEPDPSSSRRSMGSRSSSQRINFGSTHTL